MKIVEEKMVKVNTVTIDNIEYIIIDDITLDDNRYIYLIEDNNPTKFMIRKIKIIDGSEYLVNLDNNAEFDKASQLFKEKNHE